MAERAEEVAEERDADLESLLAHIRDSRGFDFSAYKRSSLQRRISKRLEALEVSSYAEYQDHLELHPEEFTLLFDILLINVTSFFRDEQAWQYVAKEIIPALIQALPDGAPIRVWSAACASGEEPYTIAMLLAEALGEEAFLERVKIYATDIDEDALAQARLASYPVEEAKQIPPALLERYWQVSGNRISFRSDLRRCVIFGRNDLVQDAPISRVDLLISRNALMYFIPETQARILSHFNFALNPHGFLFLGKSEMLLSYGGLFKPENLKWRVFTKVPRAGIRERLTFLTSPGTDLEQGAERYVQLRDGAAASSPVAQVVVDKNGVLAFANDSARSLFGIALGDLGRPIQDLEISYRPMELRAPLADALQHRHRLHLGRTQLLRGDRTHTLDVDICPLSSGGAPIGVSVTFADVTELVDLAQRYEDQKRQLATAYEELQSTVEELETTNEELQSTNEELETTNEELQSTNEELETMNEELQSTNDELEAMNEQQRERADEVDRLNLFLEGILGSLGVGVVVLDSEQLVQVWNASAAELWGLRADEVVGRHFLSLDIGLPVDDVRGAIRAVLSDGGDSSALTLDSVNRRGRSFECDVRVLPLLDRGETPYGAILLMSDRDGDAGPGGSPAEQDGAGR